MPKSSKPQTYCTNCFKSLGVESRMEIFRFLAANKKRAVTDVVEHLGLTQPTVSYHLIEMRKAGILKAEKSGKEVYYSVEPLCPHKERVCALKNISVEREGYVQ